MGREQDVMVVPEPEGKKYRFTGKTFILISFLIVVGFLSYFAFGGSSFITGNFIGVGDSDLEDKFPMSAELGPIKSELSFNQEIRRIYIEPKKSKKRILLGRVGAINLAEINNPEVVIEGFDGKLRFDAGNIVLLEGVASKVVVNGIPTVKSEGKIVVSIDGSLPYEFLELEGAYLKRYEEEVTGKIVAKDRTSFVLTKEIVLIKDFFGTIEVGNIGKYGIEKQGISLEGDVSGLEIDGELKVDLG